MKMHLRYFLAAAWLTGFTGAALAADAGHKNVQYVVIKGLSGNYLSGEFARNDGDMDAAVRRLGIVHRDDPKNSTITQQLQGLLLLQGKVDEAVSLASADSADNESSMFSDLLLTLRNIKNNKLDQAADVLDAAADDHSPQLWQPLLSAWVELGQHKPKKPFLIQDFRENVGRAAPLVNYHLALLNAQAGFTAAAAKNFRDAISDPKNAPERVMRRLIAFYKHHDKPSLLTPIVKIWREAHPAGGAPENLAPVVTAKDGAAEVMFTLGGIMLGSGETSDAAIYFQLALYLKPGADDAALALGDAYSSLGQYASADQVYGRIPEDSPLYARARLHVAVNEDSLGQLNDALALLDTLAKRPSQASDALITKGDLLRLHKRYAEAAAAYGEGLSLLPSLKEDYWPVLFARGACLEREGKWEQAKTELREALKIEPGQPDVLNYLGY
ncbi:MAG: tetratricopeptide repeat protein, partial [Pseudomonadota bacterium]|nr:tetratricopeptide repeat protein [Pseudomonadota bacterium]